MDALRRSRDMSQTVSRGSFQAQVYPIENRSRGLDHDGSRRGRLKLQAGGLRRRNTNRVVTRHDTGQIVEPIVSGARLRDDVAPFGHELDDHPGNLPRLAIATHPDGPRDFSGYENGKLHGGHVPGPGHETNAGLLRDGHRVLERGPRDGKVDRL